MIRARTVAAFALLAALSAAADADPPASEDGAVESAAGEVARAVEGGDATALARLAARESPDPWLVVDRLLERGAGTASARFSAARPDETERMALERYAATAAGPARADAVTVPELRAGLARGRALAAAGRGEEAFDVVAAVAQRAVALGWPRGAAEASLQAGRWAYEGSRAAHAIPLLTQAATWARRSPGSDLYPKALTLLGEAHLLLGWHRKALETYATLLEVGAARSDPALRATAFEGRGSVFAFQSRSGETVEAWSEAVRLRREAGDQVALVRSLGRSAGTVVVVSDRHEEAIRWIEEALALLPKVDEPALKSEVLSRAGAVWSAVGRLAEAKAAYEELLALHEGRGATFQGIDASTGSARLARRVGDAAEFRRHVEAIGAALEKVPRGRQAVEARQRLAELHVGAQEWAPALSHYERALADAEALGEPGLVARVLDHFAGYFDFVGRVADRIRLLERLVAATERSGPAERLVSALTGLAYARMGTGRPEEALAVAVRAVALSKANDLPFDEAQAERAAATVYTEVGDKTLALEAAERAHALLSRLGTRIDVAVSSLDLALHYRAFGRHVAAMEMIDAALAVAEAEDRPSLVARALTAKAGLLFLFHGDPKHGIGLARRALALLGAGGTPAQRIGVLYELGMQETFLGNHAVGAAHLKEAAILTERMRTGLGDLESLHHRKIWSYLWTNGGHAATMSGEPETLAWFLEGGHAAALRDALTSGGDLERVALPEAVRAGEAAARHRYRAAGEAYRGALESGDVPGQKRASAELTAAQSDLQRVLDRAAREARSGAELAFVAPDPLPELRRRLEPSDALVLYFLDEVVSSGLFEASALVVRRDSARIVRLGSSRFLNSACDAIVRGDGTGVDERKLPFLRKRAVEPLALGEDVTRVLVSPAGRLGYVPLALLFPGRDACFVPSGTTLRVLRESAGARGDGVLGAGDPAYGDPAPADADAARHGRFARRLERLPHTADEVRAVSDVVLLGEEANVAALSKALASRPRWRSVHLACHGLIDTASPLFSALALAPTKDDDGHLTAFDVMGMRVPADLVVLSACETARGTQFAAEGVVGLMRAFMHAGAPRIVCSQWKVDDAATAALMTRFYALWNPKDATPALSAAGALRRAQEWVAAQPKWSAPRYWAAWVLWGLPE